MSPSRLFWFAVGGVSAFWWIRKHDEERMGRWAQNRVDPERRIQWHCMKHSWRRRDEASEGKQVQAGEIDMSQIDKDVEVWKREAKEKLAKALENGLDGAVGVIASLEAAFSDRSRSSVPVSRANVEVASGVTPLSSPEASVPPTELAAAPRPSTPSFTHEPKVFSPSAPKPAESQVLAEILSAIEKLNTRLDAQEKKSDSADAPRWV